MKEFSEDGIEKIYRTYHSAQLRIFLKKMGEHRKTKDWSKNTLIDHLLDYSFDAVVEKWSLEQIRESLSKLKRSQQGSRQDCLVRLYKIAGKAYTQTKKQGSPSSREPILRKMPNYTLLSGHSIEINCHPDDNIFPKAWYLAPINAQYSTVDVSERSRSHQLAVRAFDKYPASILEKLKKIVFFNKLSFYGQSYGGTYNRDVIFISNKGFDNGYSDSFIEGSIHHEFSSIIRQAYGISKLDTQWYRFLPEGFCYGAGGLEAIKTGQASLQPKEQYWKKGFYCQYALSASEEDFNVIAEALWLGEKTIWIAMEKSSLFRSKCVYVMEIYASFDISCTEEFFQGLVQDK